ncbi:MAG: DUF4337 domain-containing protein [Abitibacteriaceae bacterium]|nr:DUF4337 domain-containing protein [Abditibacteriaceae bacterium]MBV9868249.1 DUF4337 domain-containing protein [Abditibacteriaceae bacterium]
MPEEPEVETKELQETIEELQEERKERAAEAKASSWTRYVALTTAFLAVFAAIGALQAGALVNEAMMLQLKASDKWNEYEADRQKDHMYSVAAYSLLDQGVKPAGSPESHAPSHATTGAAQPDTSEPTTNSKTKKEAGWGAFSPGQRLKMYMSQVDNEREKEDELKTEAQKTEKESATNMELHEKFARSVTLIQVAVALSAIAALAKLKPVWIFSILVGLSGIIIFASAYLAKLHA